MSVGSVEYSSQSHSVDLETFSRVEKHEILYVGELLAEGNHGIECYELTWEK